MKVAVFGACGRVGAAVCGAVHADPDLELVAAVNTRHAGIELREATGVDVPGLRISGDPNAIAEAGADVAVDFTVIEAARENAQWCAENGVHAVIGTSGFSTADYEAMRTAFTKSNCLVAPNFAIGAVLMMRFAELAAPFFDSAEIIELHHDNKLDAPSGTAVETAKRMAAASDQWAPDPTRTHSIEGARGAEGAGGIRIHAVRLRGIVSHQEVVLGTTGQSLSIRHDSLDVSSFMPGVVLAVKGIADHPGLTVGLDAFLGL